MLAVLGKNGQCLFCSCRALLSARPPKSRRIHNGARRDFSTKGASRREAPGPSLPVSRGFNQAKTLLSPDQVLIRTIDFALPMLKSRLESRKISAEANVNRLKALDPTGEDWRSFKRRLTSLLESPEEGTSKQDLKLLSDVGKAANGPNWASELTYTLHYGFIDYVLEQRQLRAKAEGGVSLTTDLRYPTEWFARARQIQRDVHLHVGPTNSGKTYNALKRLEESGSGFYAGPLRLLAHEVYSRFKAKGVPCDLITGDDVRLDDNVNVDLAASTVEMVDTGRSVEVAVIDEIQMMESVDRGWAWTRAFLGANAKEVHLCGENRVVPLIRELTASMGDTLHIHEYKRLNPLKVMSKSLEGDFRSLKKGDCVVSFSIVTIHALKKQIEVDTGRRCAIVYGSLPPETRAQQAALFNNPDNDYDYLVASDAIGMGLNLSVKRIIFHSVMKFNGKSLERLSIPQIKQIAGRAGRYRSAHQAMTGSKKPTTSAASSVGLVTTLHKPDLAVIQEAMEEEASPIKKAGILPPGDYLEELAARLPKGVPFEYILQRVCASADMHPRFSVCDIREQSSLSRVIEDVEGLTLSQRLTLSAAPASSNTGQLHAVLKALAEAIGARREVNVTDIPEIQLEVLEAPLSGDRKDLERLEDLHKSLILFLWLSYRFIHVFKDRDMATFAKELAEEKINTCLLEFSANPLLRKRALTTRKYYAAERSIPLFVPEGTDQLGLPDVQDSGVSLDWTQGTTETGLTGPEAEVEPVATAA